MVRVEDFKNALQMLRLELSRAEEETLLLAQETRAVSENGKMQPIVLRTVIIPLARDSKIADVKIKGPHIM